MSVYAIAQLRIHDRERYMKYQNAFLPILEKHDGEVLVVEEEPQVAEGEWPWTRTVVLRFPSAEKLQAWYASDEYQEIVKHRHAASEANIIVAREFDPAMLAGS